ncbi:acyl-coenzyme A synthetase/AMP-(fatty) acid ligase [Xanthomonas arboricola]|uniref:restriction endonuclease n=1 Tax=Xanthomonas sp. 3793 TaxID=3035312 RepID=UPI002168AD18|nr:restriction endonuclease [Xanthomonas sp. 3793]MCS3748287.1 acyl-coenzyme A synthetase/AMP-(fatty) acid ligase [Xanthomonas sp. 3793]
MLPHLGAVQAMEIPSGGASVVREIYALLAQYKASAVKSVCSGLFTSDAEKFEHDKPIALASGAQLLEKNRQIQLPEVARTADAMHVDASFAKRLNDAAPENFELSASTVHMWRGRTSGRIRCSRVYQICELSSMNH